MAIEQLMQAVISATPAKRRELERVLRGETTTKKDGDKEDNRLVSISAAARLLGLSRNSTYRLIQTQRLDVVELSGSRRVTMKSIKDFASGLRPANEKTAELVQESRARYAATKAQGKDGAFPFN